MKTPRPKNRMEKMLRRLRFAKSSQAIEGIHLTSTELSVFEECIKDGYSPSKLSAKLEELSACYAKSLL